jgi:molybdopterin biosynthesis enzyme
MVREENGDLVVEPVPVQGSGVLSAIVRANCFFIIPETVNHAAAGMKVDVIKLEH